MDQRLVIRRVHPGDDAGLEDLYGSLHLDARHRRLFTSGLPGTSFFTDLATVAERGGERFVAVAPVPAPATDRVAGEAGYELLANGDGELAMTVAAEWRGRLEAVLLDAVRDAAAAAGVANLEIDVLAVDRPLLDLLRSHGAVVLRHEGWRIVRLLVGTGGARPGWPAGEDRPRLLVERPGGRWAEEATARAAGFDVVTCGGPGSGEHADTCPALFDEPCPLVEGADVVVVAGPTAEASWRDLVAAHATVHAGTDVRVEPPPATTPEHGPGATAATGGPRDAPSFESEEAPT